MLEMKYRRNLSRLVEIDKNDNFSLTLTILILRESKDHQGGKYDF